MKFKKQVVILSAILLIFCTGCTNEKKLNQTIAPAEDLAGTSDIVVWGEVKYNNEYQINIDFPSTVENIAVKKGDLVTKGSTLITLSTEDYQKDIIKRKIQSDSARAALGNIDQGALEAEINTLKNQIATKTEELEKGTNPDVKILKTSLAQAEKDIKSARNDLQNYRMLFDSGAVSQSEIDKYSNILDQRVNAKSDIEDTLTKTIKALQDNLDTLNTNLKYKEVTLNQQKNSAQATSIDFDFMNSRIQKAYLSGDNIISDLDHGIVKDISVVKGSALGNQYMAQKVIDLIDADSLYVSAEVPEEFIEQISQKSEVMMVPTANKNLKIKGHVIQIANEAVEKDGDRIVIVQVQPNDKNNILKPGYTVDVQFGSTTNNN